MAFFGVTVEKIGSMEAIPGADAILKASLDGVDFSFVVKKDQFQIGEKVLYFPIDALIPEKYHVGLGVSGKLKSGGRVKTIKLRGTISQGVVGKLNLIDSLVEESPIFPTTEIITAYLGVTKYEPPVKQIHRARLSTLPSYLSQYDIEGCERYKWVVELLMDKQVIITEKLEGQNMSVSYDPIDYKFFVNSRNQTVIEDPGFNHYMWDVARRTMMDVVVPMMSRSLNKQVTIYGELIGPNIQSNIYSLNRHEFYGFDIKLGSMEWIKYSEFLKVFEDYTHKEIYGWKKAPEISVGKTLREFLGGRTIKEASDGMSLLNPKVRREGIVIRPIDEMDIHRFGRVIIKQRSPIYLSETEN